jgi:membrane protein DedA with SNARE-associated domain
MNAFHWVLDLLYTYSQTAPLEILAFLAAFTQEIIAPIPSFPLLAAIGYFAKIQEYLPLGILFIAFFSAAGKTIAGIAYYYLADKAEDVVSLKYGRYFNLKPGQLESLGEKFGESFSHYLILIFIRAIPFLSSTIITVVSGLLKIPFKLFVISMFVGSFIQDSIYIYVGYTGVEVFKHYIKGIHSLKSIITIIIVCVILTLLYFYLHQRKNYRTQTSDIL